MICYFTFIQYLASPRTTQNMQYPALMSGRMPNIKKALYPAGLDIRSVSLHISQVPVPRIFYRKEKKSIFLKAFLTYNDDKARLKSD